MIRWEWKKLLQKRKGWLVIVLFLAAELAGTLLLTRPYGSVMEANRSVYDEYLAKVEGSLTPEKREYLENTMEELNTVHYALEQLKEDYTSGRISEEDYRAQREPLAAEDANYVGFLTLYSQYIFVRESETRSFLYPGGWEVLLTDTQPDYLFLLVLILLLTPVFCEEYACGMQEMRLTQKKSAASRATDKLVVALTLTAVLTALVEGFDLLYCAVRFGLPDGGFTLQSLPDFGGTEKQMGIREAFWLQFGLKELGYLYAALLILCLSVLLEKFALTMMLSILLLALPFLTVTNHGDFRPIPGPWSLMIGSIHLQSGEGELSGGKLTALVLEAVTVCALLLICIQRNNTNWQIRARKMGVLGCLIAILLTGCSGTSEQILYNRTETDRYETDTFLYEYKFEDDDFCAKLTDKRTGEIIDFPPDPLTNETVSIDRSIFGAGNTIYYIKTTKHHPFAGAANNVTTHRELAKFDLETMQETVVYAWNEETSWFFGLLDRESTEYYSSVIELLFVHGNRMYYSDSTSSGIQCMDLRTGSRETVLTRTNSRCISYDGTCLYYLDTYNQLVVRNLDTGKERTIESVVAEKFLLTERGIEFLNRREENTTYLWDPETDTVTRLTE